MDWQEDREDLLLIIMVILLMMLSIVIWVAFCVAVKKTARKIMELKRQRRREVPFHALISAAINRAAHGDPDARRHGLPLYISTIAQNLTLFTPSTEEELPSYEQALHMDSTPSPNPLLSSTTNRTRAPPYKPWPQKPERRLLRIAPDRAGAVPTLVLPPSYDSSTSTVYSISEHVQQSQL